MKKENEKKGILGWFASNHVAANLLMLLIIIAGLITIHTVKIEVFPEFSADIITVSVPYRGATPSDVESGVLLRVEEAVAAIDGVKEITSSAMENMGTVLIEVEEYADTQEVLDDVKAEVDRITTFPEETEKPIITEVITRHKVITTALYGDASEKTLRVLADRIKDDLTSMEKISQVDIEGIRPYEISIEVSEETLRKYGLSFDEIADTVARSSVDIPGGSVKTSGGEILVRTAGQKYYGPEFEKIIVLTRPDGTNIRLGDIAEVKDEFEDIDLYSEFDGKRAAFVEIYRVGEQNVLDVARTVKKYIKEKQEDLPSGVFVELWEDDSKILKSRINLLEKNGYLGLILVFLFLTIFLDIRLAFWTTMGIPISFLGAFWLMPAFDVSINMISLFAFILSLGIVVDDAIVVGENIFNYRQEGLSRIDAAIKGVKEMSIPVFLAVTTTIAAFLPLLYIEGVMGKIIRVIPIIVISVLTISLVEALLILPAHLSGRKKQKRNIIIRFFDKINKFAGDRLKTFVNGPFRTFVENAVHKRFITISMALAILMICIGFIRGGYIKRTLFDPVEADNVLVTLEMPVGVPLSQTQRVVEKIENAFEITKEKVKNMSGGEKVIKHMATFIGSHPSVERQGPMTTDTSATASAHLAEMNVELVGSEERQISANRIKRIWREQVGEIAGISSINFVSDLMRTGDDISVELSHRNYDVLLDAVDELKNTLKQYRGVSDIKDDFEPGKPELKLDLKTTGRNLGLTLADLARQVRQGFYGEEVQRIQRGRDDIRVMLRYLEKERESVANIENMRIRLPEGTEIPFKEVAEVKYGRGFSTIRRVDRRRVVTVSADVDEKTANANEINNDLKNRFLPKLLGKYRALKYDFAGQQKEMAESLGSLAVNFPIALIIIYGLLAVQFRSYIQPLIVMSAIPFGIVGATFGHVLMGYNLSLLSMFGIVALSGVVVNDSLILIDLINRERGEGVELWQVIRDSSTRRFRPIMLTTLTTFLGLTPMLLEKSLQAKFLIPMAISLAFGVVFATLITLILVPSLYMILEDIKKLFLKFLSL